MSTGGFVTLVPPVGETVLRNYDPKLPPSKQPPSIPKAFLDAMAVRVEVYVDEQNVPLANELDDDDARSWHWVAYASVGTTGGASLSSEDALSGCGGGGGSAAVVSEAEARTATATQLPVATMRLVPPPHDAHPVPGSKMVFDSATGAPVWTMPTPEEAEAQPDAAKKKLLSEQTTTATTVTTKSKAEEPYAKLGRLATAKAFRGLGLSKLVVNAALQWALENPSKVLAPMTATSTEALRTLDPKEEMIDGKPVSEWEGTEEGWKGMLLVHAQTSVEKLWSNFGFVTDESMGRWWEEGIEHIGMWRKLAVPEFTQLALCNLQNEV